MYKIFLCLFIASCLTACVQKAASPVTTEMRTTYAINTINTGLSQEKLPDRYDEAVNEYIASGNLAISSPDFDAFAEEKGGLTDTNSGELYLLYVIHKGVRNIAGSTFVGEREATLNIDVQSTVFPNAATMMLVGEVIGISYMLDVSDDATGTKVLESSERLSPYVDRSAGAGGGLMGLALRGAGASRHVKDLENLAIAVATQVNDILGALEIDKPVAEALVIREAPPLPETQDADFEEAAEHNDENATPEEEGGVS